jgi:hypothetical protein
LTLSYICIRIPLQYHSQSVLSQLISGSGLTVNIVTAYLDTVTENDESFDLGQLTINYFGLSYVKQLSLEIWL